MSTAPGGAGRAPLQEPAFLLADDRYRVVGAVVSDACSGVWFGHDTMGGKLFRRGSFDGARRVAAGKGWRLVSTVWYGVDEAGATVSAPTVARRRIAEVLAGRSYGPRPVRVPPGDGRRWARVTVDGEPYVYDAVVHDLPHDVRQVPLLPLDQVEQLRVDTLALAKVLPVAVTLRWAADDPTVIEVVTGRGNGRVRIVADSQGLYGIGHYVGTWKIHPNPEKVEPQC